MKKFFNKECLLSAAAVVTLFSMSQAQGFEESNIVELSSEGPLEIREFRVNSNQIGLYEKFEITFDLSGEWDNPFDPDQIKVDAHFYDPDGEQLIVPGFFYQEYNRREDGDLEKVGDPVWKARFTPVQTGEYSYQMVVNNKGEEITTAPQTFNSVAYNANHGFLRISKTNPLYFEFDDGTPFFGVAMGRCCGNNAEMERLYRRFSPVGGNFNRVFLTNGPYDIEELSISRGRPDRGLGFMNLETSWNLDQLLELGEERGIYHMLALTNQWTFNQRWEVHVFNKENGGILEDRGDYWTDEEAMRYFERRLRYIVARWGYSTSVFSWDLWNEYTAMRGGSDLSVSVPWHQRMARYIASVDAFDHVIHTNDGSLNGRDEMHDLPEMELVSTNIYMVRNMANVAETWTKRHTTRFQKPFVLSEFGTGHSVGGAGGYAGMDPERRMVHNGLWGPLMSGSASTGLAWEGNWLDHEIFYTFTKAIAGFVDDIPFSRRQWQPVEVASFTFKEGQTRQTSVSEEEEVQVGYGTQKRKAITGAVSVIGGNELRKEPVANTGEALVGRARAPGLEAVGREGSAPLSQLSAAYGDVIIEGWSGNFRRSGGAPEVYQIDEYGRVDHWESLSAVLSATAEPGGTSSVTFRAEYPVDGEFAIYVSELRDLEPAPQLTVTLDGREMLREDFLPLETEDYHPRMHNQNFTIGIPQGEHTIRVENTGGGSFVSSFELRNYILRNGPDLEVRGLQTEDYMLLWLKNQKFTLLHHMMGIELELQPEGVLELQHVPDGTWVAEWINAVDATWFKRELVESIGQKLVVETPEIEESAAVRIRKISSE